MSFKNTKKTKPQKRRIPRLRKVRVGPVTASIWENKTDKATFYNVTFERRYKDGDEWKNSHWLQHGRPARIGQVRRIPAHTKILEATQRPRRNNRRAAAQYRAAASTLNIRRSP